MLNESGRYGVTVAEKLLEITDVGAPLKDM
jgi:hypothetical protein